MEEHITEEVVKELEDIQRFLEQDLKQQATAEPEILVERLSILNAMMARTGFLLAVAKADQDRATKRVFQEYKSDICALPTSLAHKFINACCDRENFYATWIDRLNRDCVHHSDNIRTQVSFAKQNMAMVGRGYN